MERDKKRRNSLYIILLMLSLVIIAGCNPAPDIVNLQTSTIINNITTSTNITTISFYSDFITNSASTWGGFLGAGVSSGGTSSIAGQTNNITGIIALRDSTTANGGYQVRTETNAILLQGEEYAEFIFQEKGSLNSTQIRLGYQDSTSINTPVDACLFLILNNNLSTYCRNNNAQTTGSNYIISNDVWYRAIIKVNTSASSVNFLLYTVNPYTLVYNSTITSNIPKTTGRETGLMVSAFETTNNAATDIMWLDYLQFTYNKPIIYN